MTTTGTRRFQAPKGTRDFYPADMAVRRHLESAWRSVSIAHGFDEIDGPTFEHLDLYTVKSGSEIIEQLFSFRRAGGDTDYALRPEFTPTLARMYAAAASTLPRPTKWFCIPSHFRAERPQRGRLREFYQWNADVIGDPSPKAEAEVIAVAARSLEKMGLTPDDVLIKLNDRDAMTVILGSLGVEPEGQAAALTLLDRREKLDETAFREQAAGLGIEGGRLAELLEVSGGTFAIGAEHDLLGRLPDLGGERSERFHELGSILANRGLAPWCRWDLGVVRGLAYYTGTVFEVHETSGRERAIAGGGRYDRLIEMFGGPSTPAVGFAMGDVVIRLVLEERGLLDDAGAYVPRPDVFVINGREDGAEALDGLVADLRAADLHARHSHRATRNIGKLLGEAGKVRSRLAVIIGKELDAGNVVLKSLETGEQEEVARIEIVDTIRRRLRGDTEEERT